MAVDDLMDKATSAAKKILTESFGEPDGIVRILTNDYNGRQDSSPTSILTKAYEQAAKGLGYSVEIRTTPTKTDKDIPPQEDVDFIQSAQPGDCYLFITDNKYGKFSKSSLEMLPSKYLTGQGVHYGIHFRLGNLSEEGLIQYINALNADYSEMRQEAGELEQKLLNARGAVLETGQGRQLYFNDAFKQPKINCGDFTGENGSYGGNLPTGEMHTELLNNQKLEGEFEFFAYPTTSGVVFGQPLILEIQDGHIKEVRGEGKGDFNDVLKNIRERNKGTPSENDYNLIRGIGTGLNPNIDAGQGWENITFLTKADTLWGNKNYHISVGPSLEAYNSPDIKPKPIGHKDLVTYGSLHLF